MTALILNGTSQVQPLPVGSIFKLFLPANLAYADRHLGPKIAPGSTLLLEIELLEIVRTGK
jgi:FKBP-type peptidyl-prolyl cis-trans isomerase FklB